MGFDKAHDARIHVRLIGPCYKTGRLKPFRQHLEHCRLNCDTSPLGDKPLLVFCLVPEREPEPAFPIRARSVRAGGPKMQAAKKYFPQSTPSVYMGNQGYKQLDKSRAPMKPTFPITLFPAGVTDVDCAPPRKCTRFAKT